MKKNLFKRATAVGLSIATFATMGFGASAASVEYELPTSPMTVDESLITCAAHAQADVTPEVLGITNTTDRKREVPADYDEDFAKSSVLIGTFGTDINSNPNPYLYNWAYNSWAVNHGATLAEKHTLGGMTANPTAVDTEVVAELGTVRSLYYRPDILVGTNSGDYSTLIADLPENKDSDTTNDYDPVIISYPITTCNDFIENMYELANAAEDIMKADSSRTTRYGDPLDIADELTSYTVGIQSYVLEQLQKNNAEKKTVAIFDPVQSQDGVFYCVDDTISTQGTTQHARVGEFLAQTTKNVATELGKTPTNVEISGANKAYYSLTAEEIVANSDIVVTGGVEVDRNFSEDQIREMLLQYIDPSNTELVNKAKTMPIMSSSFQTAGTIGANSIENLLGMAYWTAYCYPEYVNPVYAATYWYNHFYHVTDNEKLATIIDSTMSTASKPEGITTDISGYSDSAFQSIIDEGMNYYNTNKASINDSTLDEFAANLSHSDTTPTDPSTPAQSAADFTDVASGSWYYDAVDYAVKNGLFSGTTNTTFSPDTNMTRGMFAAVLYRAEETPVVIASTPFTDVSDSDYYADGVKWAYNNGIISGISDTLYAPNDNITREQIAVLLFKTAQFDGKNTQYSGTLSTYSDAADIDSYASRAMLWAVDKGIISGYDDNTLMPRANATRAQVAQMLMKYESLS
ncbi:MAG: S-layer homology domain-containing protein [Anaerovoracaceae bacterium]|jgi:hypothetical protein